MKYFDRYGIEYELSESQLNSIKKVLGMNLDELEKMYKELLLRVNVIVRQIDKMIDNNLTKCNVEGVNNKLK